MVVIVFEYYDITLQGKDRVTLTYKLEQHRPAQVWAGLMHSATVSSLRPTLNPWQNFDKSVITERITRIEKLIDEINEWMPDQNKIIGKWDHNNHQESVNRFHVHFPEQEKTETDPLHRSQLSEYNDLIHEIESLAVISFTPKPRLLICPDRYDNIPLMDDDYKLFRARRFFGELCLHYCHVGRHPYELYAAGDVNCPIDQILPQNSMTTFHTLRFYNDEYMEHWHKGRFQEFYDRSTLKQVLDFNDPKMAFGYITMGKLMSSNTQQEVLDLVSNCNKIIDWKVY
jgi:hypothetical protein